MIVFVPFPLPGRMARAMLAILKEGANSKGFKFAILGVGANDKRWFVI